MRLEVIIEAPVSKLLLLRRRVRRLGLVTVLGQILFMTMVVPVLRRAGRRRVAAIKTSFGLDDEQLPSTVRRVASANSAEVQALLRSLDPAVVVVNGTRILTRETLDSAAAPFINMHAGLTPAFRGVHGGYWALVEKRPDLVGTTIHRVDDGIDTGAILAQVRFAVTAEDSFWTYPYLHTAHGIPALLSAVEAAVTGSLVSRASETSLASTLRHHPTVWTYFSARFRRGVH